MSGILGWLWSIVSRQFDVKSAVQSGDIPSLTARLRDGRVKAPELQSMACESLERGKPSETLTIALSLALVDRREATSIISELITSRESRAFIVERKFDALPVLVNYLTTHEQFQIVQILLEHCSDERRGELMKIVVSRAGKVVGLMMDWRRNDGTGRKVVCNRLLNSGRLCALVAKSAFTAFQSDHLDQAIELMLLLQHCNVAQGSDLSQRMIESDLVRGATLLRRLDSQQPKNYPQTRSCISKLIGCDSPALQIMLRQLTDGQFAAVENLFKRSSKVIWLNLALERDSTCARAVAQLRHVGATDAPLIDEHQKREILGRRLDDVLHELREHLTTSMVSSQFESCIRQTQLLSELCDTAIDVDLVEGVLQRLNDFTVSGLIPAAILIKAVARPEWAVGLRSAWLRIDSIARRRSMDEAMEPSEQRLPALEIAALEIAGAWATCASKDADYRDFCGDEKAYKLLSDCEDAASKIEKEQKPIIDFLEKLHQERRKTGLSTVQIENHVFTEVAIEQLVERVRKLERLKKNCYCEHEKLYEQFRESVSPGFLLRLTVLNAQRYPVGVRQAAAHGLIVLLDEGHLDENTSNVVIEALGDVMVPDSDRFRERHILLLPDAGRHAAGKAIHDGLEWMRRMEQFAPVDPPQDPEADDLNSESSDCVDSETHMVTAGDRIDGAESAAVTFNTDTNGGFDSNDDDEFESALLPSGLAAAKDSTNVETGEDGPQTITLPSLNTGFKSVRYVATLDGPKIQRVCDCIFEQIPNAVRFFEQFPLRLMPLDEHQRALGMYSMTTSALKHWVRFSGKLNEGPVQSRYLRLEDRSEPNSMGIYYGLFEHPFLAVPVIYHEFLHYGGVRGIPSEGIVNETEVRIRECLFARKLIAELAPQDDGQLSAFEQKIVTAAEITGTQILVLQLLDDFYQKEHFAQLNSEITSTYGPPLDDDEAVAKANITIEDKNAEIRAINLCQTWDPDVKYPELDTEATISLTKTWRRLQVVRLQQDHTLAAKDRDKVLSEPQSQEAIEHWEKYCRRPGALAQFREARDRWMCSLRLKDIMKLFVQRFEFIYDESSNLTPLANQEPGLAAFVALLEKMNHLHSGDIEPTNEVPPKL